MATRAVAERLSRSLDEVKRRADGARAEKARRSLAEFVRQAWHVLEPGVELEWNWHHEVICNHVQWMLEDWNKARRDRTLRQRCQNLAINVCPASLKSRIVMVFAPAWMWLRCPSWSVLCSSGSPSNVDRDSLACRDLVTSTWYRETFRIAWQTTELEVEIRGDMDRVSKWGTTEGGIRESRSMSGSFTGVHVDAIFLDDPDDAARVWGDAARRDTWLSWQAMGNRLNNLKLAVRIVMQQNVHAEDLTSKLVEKGWPRLAIPLEFAPARRITTPFGWTDPRTVANDNLHPARFTPEVVADEKLRLGTHGFEAQYNCNPTPLDGGMIKRAWLRFFRLVDGDTAPRQRPDGCTADPAFVLGRLPNGELDLDWLTITVDSTFGSLDEKTASAVGLLVVGGKGQRRFVFADRTLPMTFGQTKVAIRALIAAYPVKRVLIELKANGSSVIDDLRDELAKGEIVEADGKVERKPLLGPDGHPAVVVLEAIIDVRDSKEARAAAMVPAYEAGLVFLLDGAAWLEDHLAEVCVFPASKRNDRVDAMSQLMKRYRVRNDNAGIVSGAPVLLARQ